MRTRWLMATKPIRKAQVFSAGDIGHRLLTDLAFFVARPAPLPIKRFRRL
jgi:hypothetical protein